MASETGCEQPKPYPTSQRASRACEGRQLLGPSYRWVLWNGGERCANTHIPMSLPSATSDSARKKRRQSWEAGQAGLTI